jgi:DNA-binding transcriptional LysR family regulator
MPGAGRTSGCASTSARVAATVRTPDEWCEAISVGLGLAVAAASAARYYDRPGIVYRPLLGVAPSEILIAWRADHDQAPVQDLVAA